MEGFTVNNSLLLHVWHKKKVDRLMVWFGILSVQERIPRIPNVGW